MRRIRPRTIYNGGKRPFGFDIVGTGKDHRLVPNTAEQAALARAKALRADGASLRDVGEVWATEFGVRKDAKSIQRMLAE